MHSLYDIMMLKKDCTQKELREKYFKLTRMYNPNSRSGCYQKYLEVVRAYNILRDQYKRDFYDNFGELGLENIKDPRMEYFLTRTFDFVNTKLIVVVIILSILNITSLPLSLYFHKHLELCFTVMFFPLMMASTLTCVFVIRSILHLIRYKAEMLKKELIYMTILFLNFFLTLLQIIIMCYVVDAKVERYKFTWMFPYLLIEKILCIQYAANNQNSLLGHIKANIPRVLRISLMKLFVIDISMKFKIFIPFAICLIELIYRRIPYKKILNTCFSLYIILCGVYICMVPPCRWCAYILGTIYIMIGIVLASVFLLTKKKYTPVCRFGDQIALEYEV